MPHEFAQPPRCRACTAVLTPPGHVCQGCGSAQAAPAQQQMVVPGPTRSAGVAVLLSILWLGAGHLYAGRIASGLVLMIWDAILVLCSFFVVALVITVPLWIISVIPVAMLAANAATKANRQNQVVLTYSPS